MGTMTLDGAHFQSILLSGIAVLETNKDVVNNLNVFPVPDGDTGTNMCMTASAAVPQAATASIADMSVVDARSMMRAARGNSGVILSLFFRGLAKAFAGHDSADPELFLEAMREGARSAAAAVENPVEGTILTVMRECATDIDARGLDFEGLFDLMYKKSEMILERTPEMLPALRRARVVDSGGYGFVRILEGMRAAVMGKEVPRVAVDTQPIKSAADFDMFDEEEIKFSFCTECLVDLDAEVPENILRDLKAKLGSMGDSMVLTTDEEIFKIHIHTNEPLKVLGMIFPLGIVRTSKIENMKLQHTGLVTGTPSEHHHEVKEEQPKKKYGIFAVSPGDGFSDLFKELGADAIISGGQSMNPSARDFVDAFRSIPAQTIFVLPNNGNIILAAKQAAKLYTGADIRVIESRTVGEGYAAISMFEDESSDADAAEQSLCDALGGVITAEVSRSIRDSGEVKEDEYIGISGKDIIAHSVSRLDAARETTEKLGIGDCDVCIILRSADAPAEEAEELERSIRSAHPCTEVYLMYGGQPVYDYILILE